MQESMGHKLVEGNNFTITLSPDSNAEADRFIDGRSSRGDRIYVYLVPADQKRESNNQLKHFL